MGAMTQFLHSYNWEETGLPIADTVGYWKQAIEQTFAFTGCGPMAPFEAFYRITQTAPMNTPGGTLTAGVQNTRDLTTVEAGQSDEFVSIDLDNDVIGLKNGRYVIEFGALSLKCGAARSFLVRNGTRVASGLSTRSPTADGVNTLSSGLYYGAEPDGLSEAAFQLVTYCSNTRATDGQGSADNILTTELYAYINIWRAPLE
jgi:hypothetical protein